MIGKKDLEIQIGKRKRQVVLEERIRNLVHQIEWNPPCRIVHDRLEKEIEKAIYQFESWKINHRVLQREVENMTISREDLISLVIKRYEDELSVFFLWFLHAHNVVHFITSLVSLSKRWTMSHQSRHISEMYSIFKIRTRHRTLDKEMGAMLLHLLLHLSAQEVADLIEELLQPFSASDLSNKDSLYRLEYLLTLCERKSSFHHLKTIEFVETIFKRILAFDQIRTCQDKKSSIIGSVFQLFDKILTSKIIIGCCESTLTNLLQHEKDPKISGILIAIRYLSPLSSNFQSEVLQLAHRLVENSRVSTRSHQLIAGMQFAKEISFAVSSNSEECLSIYNVWFTRHLIPGEVSDDKKTLCISCNSSNDLADTFIRCKRSLQFLFEALNQSVGEDSLLFLKSQLKLIRSLSIEFQPFIQDYTTLAKTRIYDLEHKQGVKLVSTTKFMDGIDEIDKIATEYCLNGTLPLGDMRIFRKAHWDNHLKPILLEIPTELSETFMARTKLAHALYVEGEITSVSYSLFLEGAEKLLKDIADRDKGLVSRNPLEQIVQILQSIRNNALSSTLFPQDLFSRNQLVCVLQKFRGDSQDQDPSNHQLPLECMSPKFQGNKDERRVLDHILHCICEMYVISAKNLDMKGYFRMVGQMINILLDIPVFSKLLGTSLDHLLSPKSGEMDTIQTAALASIVLHLPYEGDVNINSLTKSFFSQKHPYIQQILYFVCVLTTMSIAKWNTLVVEKTFLTSTTSNQRRIGFLPLHVVHCIKWMQLRNEYHGGCFVQDTVDCIEKMKKMSLFAPYLLSLKKWIKLECLLSDRSMDRVTLREYHRKCLFSHFLPKVHGGDVVGLATEFCQCVLNRCYKAYQQIPASSISVSTHSSSRWKSLGIMHPNWRVFLPKESIGLEEMEILYRELVYNLPEQKYSHLVLSIIQWSSNLLEKESGKPFMNRAATISSVSICMFDFLVPLCPFQSKFDQEKVVQPLRVYVFKYLMHHFPLPTQYVELLVQLVGCYYQDGKLQYDLKSIGSVPNLLGAVVCAWENINGKFKKLLLCNSDSNNMQIFQGMVEHLKKKDSDNTTTLVYDMQHIEDEVKAMCWLQIALYLVEQLDKEFVQWFIQSGVAKLTRIEVMNEHLLLRARQIFIDLVDQDTTDDNLPPAKLRRHRDFLLGLMKECVKVNPLLIQQLIRTSFTSADSNQECNAFLVLTIAVDQADSTLRQIIQSTGSSLWISSLCNYFTALFVTEQQSELAAAISSNVKLKDSIKMYFKRCYTMAQQLRITLPELNQLRSLYC